MEVLRGYRIMPFKNFRTFTNACLFPKCRTAPEVGSGTYEMQVIFILKRIKEEKWHFFIVKGSYPEEVVFFLHILTNKK